MFAALRLHNYRVYQSGAFVSNIGTWMQRVAQDWLVLELSGGSGLAVGITTALQFLPTLVVSPYGGVIADRFDKRAVLRFSQTWMAVCALVLGLLAINGVATTEMVYGLALLFGVGSAIDVPARQSFVSEMVPGPLLPNAIGLNAATFHTARIIGPAVAGLVIAAFGSGWAILSNAVTYVAFLLALSAMDASQLTPSERTARAKGQIREGMAYVRGRSDLLLVLCIAFCVGTFGMNFQLTSALMAQQEFGKGAEEYGILGTFMAFGSLAGALLAARRTRAPRLRFVIGASVVFGLMEIVAGLMPGYWSFAAFLPLLGLSALLALTAANATVQMGSDPTLRGRVMALYSMVLMGGTPIGAPVIGFIGEHFGPRWTLIGGGGLVVVGVLLSVLLVVRSRHIPVPTARNLLSRPAG
ncbi:MFS transporter [Auraticoccus sp. F435]|uniref:MFS transporter n=1 Tax=Auraticoccus cholistanensis TaxID=2656650 RepID=A0A6A9V104_9ACTN|nr:MFS transporter [Auraticoccus cholistanensis]MVA76569.1 MFS transporter [Auraticoccus cholistanensis]